MNIIDATTISTQNQLNLNLISKIIIPFNGFLYFSLINFGAVSSFLFFQKIIVILSWTPVPTQSMQ